MNYKDKYIKYKSKYLQLQNQAAGSKVASVASVESVASVASVASATTLPPRKPKSVPTQDQGQNSTCWAHGYARSFVRTFQVLDIITDDKVEQWYDLFFAILLKGKTCDKGQYFIEMVYLFNFLKNNIDEIFRITKENIKCVTFYCSEQEKNTPILQFDREEQKNEIKKNLQFLFVNELIFLAKYPYAVNPDGTNLPTQAIKEMLDLRLQPVLNVKFSNSLRNFIKYKKTNTYDLFPHINEDNACSLKSIHSRHLVVLRSWRNNRIELKNSWGPNKNFAISDLKYLICKKDDSSFSSIIDIACLMINHKKLDKYNDFKIKVDNKIAKYYSTFGSDLTVIRDPNYTNYYDEYGFPNGENCELKNYQNKTFFKGNLIHGIKNGTGEEIFNNGNIYIGNWKDDEKNGTGEEIFNNGNIYIGNWKDDEKNGTGKEIINNGNVYEGDWKDNEKNGKGIQRYKSGNVYEGNWKDNKKNGYGIQKYKIGKVYEGNWKDNEKNGNGIEIDKTDDTTYNGNWENGKKHGHGKHYFPHGEYEGNWIDDKKDGYGIEIYKNTNVYNGYWKNNTKHGIGILKLKNGTIIHEGEWNNISL
jgi:hypothetical protein